MRVVSHREMRNSSGEILRAVAAGETIQVTNNGRVAALIVPPPADDLQALVERGGATPPRADRRRLLDIPRIRSDRSSRSMIEDLRNPW